MDPLNLKPSVGPEKIIQRKGTRELRDRGWFVDHTHGNEFQNGVPDTFACCIRHGPRWIEWKSGLSGCRLEESQIRTFTHLSEKRIGIWILTGATNDELAKLLKPANWYLYLDVMKTVTRDRVKTRPPKEYKKRIASSGPERDIQELVKAELEAGGWFVIELHGNTHQHGFPDLYAAHREWGARWIEIKNPSGYRFTPAQLEKFPLFCAHGSGVWIIDGKGQLDRLFRPPNWYSYLECMK